MLIYTEVKILLIFKSDACFIKQKVCLFIPICALKQTKKPCYFLQPEFVPVKGDLPLLE